MVIKSPADCEVYVAVGGAPVGVSIQSTPSRVLVPSCFTSADRCSGVAGATTSTFALASVSPTSCLRDAARKLVVEDDVAGIRNCPGVGDQTTGDGGRNRTGQRDPDARGGGDRADGGRSGVRDRVERAKVLAGPAESGGDRAGVGRNGVSDVEVGGHAGRQRAPG